MNTTLRDRRDDEQRGSPYDAKFNVAEIGAVNMGGIGASENAAAKACRTRAPPAALSVGCGWRRTSGASGSHVCALIEAFCSRAYSFA